jgi:hypothetical protein
MKRGILFIFVLSVILVQGCNRNRYNVPLKGVEAKIDINRFDKTLFSTSPEDLPDTIRSLKSSGSEIPRLFGLVINIGDITGTRWEDNMLMFATDKQNIEVYEEVEKKFPTINDIEDKLTGAWSHYSYYFPDSLLPRVYTFVSGFNNSIVIGDSTLGIGLDRYLGRDCRFYPMLGIYNYEILKMIPEKIPSDCMYAWASSTWPFDSGKEGANSLLASMIHEGKLMYFTRCMLPSEPDTLIFGFTADQMKFCHNNENQMWEYMVEYDLLFNTDPLTIKKLTGEAPFTSYFTKESPGRAAVWIAFRIIEDYMKNNGNMTLAELMNLTDYQSILEGARYSPK